MTDPHDCRIDPTVVAALYVRHADELRAFLLGVLRDGHLAADVLQTTFVKAIEQGHTAQEESLKSWLFQVAYREALLVKRRQGVHERAVRRVAGDETSAVDVPGRVASLPPDDLAVRNETIEQVQAAVARLSPLQQQVVRLRMNEGLKFAEIASRLKEPLGTVLARMQAALKRLRERLEP